MSLVAREVEVWEIPTRRRIWIGLNSTSPGIKFDLMHVRSDGHDTWYYTLVAGTNAEGRVMTFVSRHSQRRHVMPKWMSELEWPTVSRAFTSISYVDNGLYILANGTTSLYAVKMDETSVTLKVDPLTSSLKNLTVEGILEARVNRFYIHKGLRIFVRTDTGLYFKDNGERKNGRFKEKVQAAEWVSDEEVVCVVNNNHIVVINMFEKQVAGWKFSDILVEGENANNVPRIICNSTGTASVFIGDVEHLVQKTYLGVKMTNGAVGSADEFLEYVGSSNSDEWKLISEPLTTVPTLRQNFSALASLNPWVAFGTPEGNVYTFCAGQKISSSTLESGKPVRSLALFPGPNKRLFALQDNGMWDMSMNEETLGPYDFFKMVAQYTVPVAVALIYFFYFK